MINNNKVCSYLLACILAIGMLLPTTAQAAAQEEPAAKGEIDMTSLILGHIGDSYEWHFWGEGENAVAIPLPILVYSRERSQWFFFNFHHLEEAEKEGITYQGFKLADAGHPDAGKVVEYNSTTGNWERPLDLSLTKNAVGLIINSILLICIVLGCAHWYKNKKPSDEAPRGFVGLMEMMISMVYNDIIKANIPQHVQRYSGYLLCAFFFIFFTNLIGLIPGSANITGNIAVTFVLAACTFLFVNLGGNKEYWKEIFWADVPGWLKPIMAVIEFFGIFTKPVALMIRLFANIMAGHAALLALIGVIFITANISPVINGIMTPLSVIFAIFLDCLECLVAFIQAYVFTMLSAVFIGLSVPKHHAEA
ncbi:MAG: F0F1 ATP synthase subunit A [Bacteroidales bacterium]|nr:F0F1 ATP synthase subunit A [Bacteroidales bacterium]